MDAALSRSRRDWRRWIPHAVYTAGVIFELFLIRRARDFFLVDTRFCAGCDVYRGPFAPWAASQNWAPVWMAILGVALLVGLLARRSWMPRLTFAVGFVILAVTWIDARSSWCMWAMVSDLATHSSHDRLHQFVEQVVAEPSRLAFGRCREASSMFKFAIATCAPPESGRVEWAPYAGWKATIVDEFKGATPTEEWVNPEGSIDSLLSKMPLPGEKRALAAWLVGVASHIARQECADPPRRSA